MKKISSIIFILAIICANSVLFRGHRFPFFRRPHFGPRISNVKININGKLIENAYLFKPVKSEKAKNNPEVTDQDIKQMNEKNHLKKDKINSDMMTNDEYDMNRELLEKAKNTFNEG